LKYPALYHNICIKSTLKPVFGQEIKIIPDPDVFRLYVEFSFF